MAGHAPAPTVRAIAEQAARGITTMMPTEDSLWVGGGAGATFRPAVLAGRAHGDRRQPQRAAHRAAHNGAPQGTGLQLVLPRLGRRGAVCPAGRRLGHGPAGLGRPARHRQPGHQGDRVQRRRGARAGARAGRRRLRAGRAGADQHRHRAARAGLSRRAAAPHARDRHAADHRRDAHDLRRARRLHAGLGPRARHGDARQADRRRRPLRRLRVRPGDRRPASTGTGTTKPPTRAASAARWPATRCRWPPSRPHSARCSPRRRSRT